MKVSRLISIGLSFFILIMLVGCQENTTTKSSIKQKISNWKIQFVNNDVNDNTNTSNQESTTSNQENENGENGFHYQIKRSKALYPDGVYRIDTYQEYVELLGENSTDYNEAFFEASSLIYYGSTEGSGSISVKIDSVNLDIENNLMIHVSKYYPSIGTCDIAYHAYLIEYHKLSEPIKEVSVRTSIIKEKVKEIILKNQESSNEIKAFLTTIKNNILAINAMFWFRTDDSYENIPREDLAAYFQSFNNGRIDKYGIDGLNGRLFISSYSPTVQVSLSEFDDNKLNKLTNIALNAELGTVYVQILYLETSIIENRY